MVFVMAAMLVITTGNTCKCNQTKICEIHFFIGNTKQQENRATYTPQTHMHAMTAWSILQGKSQITSHPRDLKLLKIHIIVAWEISEGAYHIISS